MNPAERTLIARIAAHESWAKTTDPAARTAPARRAAADRFRREMDEKYPDATPAQRSAMAEAARKAWFLRLARKSAQARSQRRQSAPTTDDGDTP